MTSLANQLGDIARRYGLRDVYAFGSRAREVLQRISDPQTAVTHASSDVDIAVQPVGGRGLSARERVRLADELEGLLETPRVDLVVLSEAPPLLSVEIIRGELLFTLDPLAQAQHELYILRRAADLAPFMRERVQQIMNAGAR